MKLRQQQTWHRDIGNVLYVMIYNSVKVINYCNDERKSYKLIEAKLPIREREPKRKSGAKSHTRGKVGSQT